MHGVAGRKGVVGLARAWNAMTAPMDELLPIREATATAWVISGGALVAGVPVLGSFAVGLEHEDAHKPTQFPAWLPPHWAAHSSAAALAALGLLETPAGAAYRIPLGAQTLCLLQLPGGAP